MDIWNFFSTKKRTPDPNIYYFVQLNAEERQRTEAVKAKLDKKLKDLEHMKLFAHNMVESYERQISCNDLKLNAERQRTEAVKKELNEKLKDFKKTKDDMVESYERRIKGLEEDHRKLEAKNQELQARNQELQDQIRFTNKFFIIRWIFTDIDEIQAMIFCIIAVVFPFILLLNLYDDFTPTYFRISWACAIVVEFGYAQLGQWADFESQNILYLFNNPIKIKPFGTRSSYIKPFDLACNGPRWTSHRTLCVCRTISKLFVLLICWLFRLFFSSICILGITGGCNALSRIIINSCILFGFISDTEGDREQIRPRGDQEQTMPRGELPVE